jgi:hypothetical protein
MDDIPLAMGLWPAQIRWIHSDQVIAQRTSRHSAGRPVGCLMRKRSKVQALIQRPETRYGKGHDASADPAHPKFRHAKLCVPNHLRSVQHCGETHEGRLVDLPSEMDTPAARVFRLAELAEEIQATDDEQRRMRFVFGFLRGAEEDGQSVRLLVAVEPALTGDPRFDALLAAIAEDLCVHAEIARPAWVHSSSRYLDGFWWVSNLPSARARALVHTPASYLRRGVMLDRHDLTAR